MEGIQMNQTRALVLATSMLCPVWGSVTAAVLGTSLIVGTAAHAQPVRSVDAYWAVVDKPIALRSGDSARYYQVAELAPGTLLRVDGENAEWARVGYPAGSTAFVRADVVKQGDTPGALILTNSTRLLAPNAVAGLDGSWKTLLAESDALKPDSVLNATETVRNQAGAVIGYRVTAPPAARGFVVRSALRTPTPDELAKAGVTVPTPEATGTATGDNTAPAVPAQPVETPPATPPSTTSPAEPAPISLIDQTPAQPATTPPETSDGVVIDLTGEGPVVIEQRPTPAPAAPAGSLASLDEAFKRVQAQSDVDAEFEELRAQLQRAYDETPDTSANRLARLGLQQRIEILDLRIEWRNRMRAMEERRLRAGGQATEVQRSLEALNQARVYTITGRLITSELYNGTDLPLMLRVQSVGGLTSRTVNYIKPTPELALEGKVGQLVGVVGEVVLDPTSGLRMIQAQRVDLLPSVPQSTITPRRD